MSTLEPILHRTTREAASGFRLVLTGLRTLSGLAIVLGLGVLVIAGQDGAGGASNVETAEASVARHLFIGNTMRAHSIMVFYLVESEAQTDAAAAEEHEIWAGQGSLGVEGSNRRVSYLLARTPTEEDKAYELIVQAIHGAGTSPVVTILDKRGHSN